MVRAIVLDEAAAVVIVGARLDRKEGVGMHANDCEAGAGVGAR